VKKIKLVLGLVLALTVVFAPQVYAEDTCGKITGDFSYDTVLLDGADVSLYLIAKYDEATDSYLYEKDFKDYVLNMKNLNPSEVEIYIKTLSRVIDEKKIKNYATVKTDESGKFSFDECLAKGLYLVRTVDLKRDNYVYKSLPALLTIPSKSVEDFTDQYSVSINMKSERVLDTSTDDPSKDDNNQGNNGNNSGSNIRIPNTYDSIVIYLALFAISLILLVVLVFYINNRKKKGSNENEKM